MSRAHLRQPLTDQAGNLLPGAQVTVYEAGTTQLLGQTLYVDDSSDATLINPFIADSGVADFYLQLPQRVRLYVQSLGLPDFAGYQDVLPRADEIVTMPGGLLITNTPQAGDVLYASDTPGQAFWDQPPNPDVSTATATLGNQTVPADIQANQITPLLVGSDLVLLWGTPDNGGSPITSYTVTLYQPDGVTLVLSQNYDGPGILNGADTTGVLEGQYMRVPNLGGTLGQSVVATVTATNVVGVSTPHPTATIVVPGTGP